MTELSVDVASSTPPWEQVRDQLSRYIASGQLPSGTRLPAIRQLAADLGLSPGTIGRSYRELEREGLIRTRRPQGTFVTQKDMSREAPAQLARLAALFADQARQLGASSADAVQALQAAYRP